MREIERRVVPRVPGAQYLGFDYDPQKDLYFKVIVKENLRKLKQLATGKALLKALRDARPGKNSFPKGVNVVLQPPLSRQYSAPGLAGGNSNVKIGDQGKYDDWYYGRKGMLMPSINAKIACQGVDEREGVGKMTGSGRVGTGCACWVYYSNNELLYFSVITYLQSVSRLILCFTNEQNILISIITTCVRGLQLNHWKSSTFLLPFSLRMSSQNL